MRAFVLLLLLLGVGIGDAAAACNEQTLTCGTREEAYNRAGQNNVQATAPTYCSAGNGEVMVEGNNYPTGPTSGYTKWRRCPQPGGAGWYPWSRVISAENPTWGWATTCNLPEEQWSESAHGCISPQECLAHNAEPGFAGVGATVRGFSSKCVAGCEFKAVSGQPSVTVSVAGQAGQLTSGTFEFTGNICTAGQPSSDLASEDDAPGEGCTPAGAGQTFCMNKEGEHCYSASTGRQICWDPRQTGQQDDQDYRQTRDPGNQTIPTNLNLPNGDTLNQTGTPTTTNTTITHNNVTSNITTTVTNYVTTNGTNPGGGNQGRPTTPGGTSPPGGGGGDGTSASGGGNCETPPIVTGDAALNMVATQAWATRCAVEKGNAAEVQGDIANCAQPFTVTGTNANAIKLRAMRAEICPGDAGGMPTEEGVLGEEGDKAGLFNSPGEDGPPGSDGLDTSGYGYGGSCPAIPSVDVFGHTITLDPNGAFCDWMHLGGVFVLIIAGIVCLRLIGTS